MVRKSPDKQWTRQNSILFHETIPLKFKILRLGICFGHFSADALKNCHILPILQYTVWRFFYIESNYNVG
jgi:hypothetical protein